MTSAALSPDGKNIVAIKNKSKIQRLVLINALTGEETQLINVEKFSKRDANLQEIKWIDNHYIAAQFSEIKEGTNDLLDTKAVSHLLLIGVSNKDSKQTVIKSVRTKGQLVSPLENEPYMFLYAKGGVYSKVYKIDVRKLHKHKKKLTKLIKKDGGQFTKLNEVASVRGYATRWFISSKGTPKAVLRFDEDKSVLLNNLNDKGEVDGEVLHKWTWEELFGKDEDSESPLLNRILPVAMADEADTFYSLDYAEEERVSVFKTNYTKDNDELIFEANSFKIIDLIISPHDNRFIGARVIKNGKFQNVFLETEDNTSKNKTLSSDMEVVIGTSEDKQKILSYKEGHSQPGRYFVLDSNTGKEQYIGSPYPHLINKVESDLIEKTLLVSGLEIPYLLSIPKSDTKKVWPLIVMPHGGPIGIFDNHNFDLNTQFFVANGYAVLRTNFRGSGGYSAELKDAGNKQWGKLMLTDILKTTQEVSSRSDINTNKICAVGMSYGGYAVMMLTIQYPEVFQCAVNIAGISDINLYLNAPDRSSRQKKWLIEHVGDAEKEYELLRDISPTFLVEQLEKPVLIMHGAKDSVVDIEHAYRLKYVLEKYQKTFSWYIFPEGEHSIGDSEDANIMFSKALGFIQKQF